MAKQDDYTRYTIRVPKQIFEPIEAAAHAAGRSVNSEVIARLNDSIKLPASLFEKLAAELKASEEEVDVMEADLKNQAEDIRNLVDANAELKKLVDHSRDFEKRLMYHVLNYIDEIPAELAIWAYDMAQIAARQQIFSEQLASDGISESEALAMLRHLKDTFNEEQLEMIKAHLNSEPSHDL